MNDNVNIGRSTGVVDDAGSENVTSTSSSTSYPFQHAYYHNFPSFCKESYDITPLIELSDAISNGRSSTKDEKNSDDRNKLIGERVHHLKYIETRASDLRKLMKSLDITKIDFTKLENDEDDITSNDGVGTENDDDDDEDDDDEEQEDELEYDDDNSDQEGDELLLEDTGGMEVDNEEEKTDGNMNSETSGAKPTTSMAMFVKKCCRLNTILNTILDSRHVQVLTKEDFCQYLVKTLIMITATLRRDSNDGKLRVHLENIGQYYHVIWNDDDDEDEVTATSTSDEKDIARANDDNEDSEEQQQFDRMDRMTDPFALPAPARENLLSFAENLLTSWFIRSASLQFRLRVPVPKDGAPLVALTMQGNNNSSSTGATAAATSAETRGNDNDIALVLHWKPLYRLLYRTNPKIDEYSPGVNPPSMAHSRRNSILKKTSHLASLCRHFYDQHGVLEQYHSSKQNGVVTINLRSLTLQDTASNEIWSMICAPDLKRTHTNVMFRGVVMMYLFLPWSCTPAFYKKVIPECIQCWSSVDRCNDFDYLWLQLFSRARFYDTSGVVNWTYIRKKVISNCAYWLQIPITGSSNDRSFPTIRPMKSRTIPATLKSLFSITGNAYQEGLEFVDRLSAILIFCVGRNDDEVVSSTNSQNTSDGASTSRVCLDDVEVVENATGEKQHHVTLSSGTADLLRFLSFVGPYFNPTNVGGWTFPLGVLMTGLCTHFARRLGLELGQSLLMESYPAIAQQMLVEDFSLRECIPPEEIPPILDALLPLVQQSIYSKDGFVGKAGEQCLFFLMQISPQHVCPYFLNFASKALDVSAIHQSHQAPSALGVLARLLPSTLRRTPSEVLQRIPEISSLLLAGIDSNDRKKTIHTLSLVHSITSWLPVGAGSLNQNKKGGSPNDVNKNDKKQMGVVEYDDGTLRLGHNLLDRLSMINSSKEFHDSLMALSNRTVLHRPAIGDVQLDRDEALVYVQEHLMEASMALGDWSLLFLERIYDLMRAAGKLEKVSKDHLGASARQSANDASQAKTFSKQLMTTLMRVFLSMDAATHHKAVESVFQFITSETLPYAAKDAAGLCTAACTGDYAAEGFDVLVPALTNDLERQSLRTVTYRLRCLTGTVKFCGTNLLHSSSSKKKNHHDAIVGAIHFCLNPTKSSPFDDKHLFKVGCKLLRHTLASQVEAYPLFVDCVPNTDILGKGFELHNHDISWHIPSGTQIDFSVQLMERFAFTRLRTLLNEDSSFTLFEGATNSGGSTNATTTSAASTNIMVAEWRKTFKILKYTLRGGIGIMLDDTTSNATNNNKGDVDMIESTTGTNTSSNDHDLCPVERDQMKLIETSSMQSQQILKGLRGKLCVIMTHLLGVIANETYEAITEDPTSSSAGSTSTTATTTTTASTILSFDTKICAEISEVSDLLLTFRESHQVSGDKHSPTFDKMEDEVMATQLSHMISSLERVGAWTSHHDSLLRDGEDGGLIISRALRISKIWESYLHLRVNASYNIPRRMMKERMKWKNAYRSSGQQKNSSNKSQKRKKQIYFSPNYTMNDVKTLLSTYLNFEDGTTPYTDSVQEQRTDIIDPLDAYEGLLDGLQSLSCHPKLHVRSSANEALDSGLSCFSFLARQRVSRLLQAIQLNDEKKHGKYGVPSCERLASIQPTKRNEEEGDGGSVATVSETTISIRRKRLAEVLKGVCNLLSKPRMIRHVAASEATRYHFIQTLCNTERLLSIMPKEELQKMVHFLQVIFSKFRNRWHELPRYTSKQKSLHKECLLLLLNELDGGVVTTTGTTSSSNADRTSKREPVAASGDSEAISPDAESETYGGASTGTKPPQDDETPAASTATATTGVAAANASTITTTTDLATAANTKKMMHWRNQLLTIWFLTHLLDPLDVEVVKAEEESPTQANDNKAKNTKLELLTRVWNLTFGLIEKHEGQPIQRAALGLMGRLLTFAQCSEFNQTKTTVTQILQSKLSDETFSRNLCMAFAFNHRQDTSFGGGHKAQWSAGVEDILRDASTNVSPLPFFPLLRNDSLISSNFKLSHAFVLSSILKLLNSTESTTVIDQVCQHWLEMAKELADTSPSEDQKNMQVTAWELFAAVFRFYMKSSNPNSDKLSDTTESSSEKWKHIFDFFDDVLVPLPYELSYSAYDAIKFSIDSLKPIQYKPLSDWLLLRTSSSLWQQQLASSSTAVVDDSTGEEDSVVSATSARVDGFSSQSKWLRLGSAVLSELRNESYLLHNGRRHEGDSFVFERLEEGGKGQQGDTTTTNQRDDDDGGLEEMLQQLVDKLLPLLLNAVGHPYEKCRSLIASLLYYFCMIANCTKTLSLESENESESDFTFLQDKAVSSLIQALGRNDVSTMNFKERLNCLKTTKQFLLYSLHRGDVVVDYRNLIIPLLPVAFSSLKLSDDDDDNSKTTNNKAAAEGNESPQEMTTTATTTTTISAPDRALEAEVANDFRYMLSCVGSVFVTFDHDAIGEVLHKLDDLSKNDAWHIRQAVAHYLRCFQGCHKFIFTPDEANKATNIVASLLADERREVSSGAMGALTGILAVTDVATVSKLVDEKLIIAKRSLGKKKKKIKQTTTTSLQGASSNKEAQKNETTKTPSLSALVVGSKEKRRLSDQQSSVYFLCAVVLARPYDTPAFVPVALEALSRHSFEQRAPLAVRDTVKKCFSEFKRTHMTDNWEAHRQQFTQAQLEALEDVVSTPHYYA